MGDQALCSYSSYREMGQMGADSLPEAQRALSSLFVPLRKPGGGSAKNKAAQILANVDGALSPRMKHCFVDR
jgi:hypothetical protein